MSEVKNAPVSDVLYRKSRARHTRKLILGGALSEFAERGFEGASLRSIAKRADQKYQLVTYYYKAKDDLWRAVAEDAFDNLAALWDMHAGEAGDLGAIQQLRREFRIFFMFTLENPDFHQFMLQEIRRPSARLDWVVERYLDPFVARVLPQIEAAQSSGLLPQANPILIHNMLITAVSSLTTLSATLLQMTGLCAKDEEIQKEFWHLIEQIFFGGLRLA